MFLDITASHEGRGAIFDVVARTADVCFMPVGGGRRRPQRRGRARRLLRAGADKVSINTAAVEDPRPDQPLRRRLRLAGGGGGDRRQARAARGSGGRNDGWQVFTYGGRRPTGLDVVDYASRRWSAAPARSC